MSPSFPFRCALTRVFVGGLTAVAVVLLAGCWKSRLAWSPDGARLAIVTSEGLRLADASGALSRVVVPDVYLAAWLDNSRLVLARTRALKTLRDMEAALGPERMRVLAAKAEGAWQQIEAGTPIGKLSFKPDADAQAIAVYLRERRREALRAKAGNDWEGIEQMKASWSTIVLARVDADNIELRATLHEGLSDVGALRVSPHGDAVAFTTRGELLPENDDAWQLRVVSPSGGPSQLVAVAAAVEPDWTPDGRTLVFLRSANTPVVKDDLRLGTLAERRVIDDAGKIALAKDTRELAGLIFQDANRVRCLADGRVVFDAAEFRLPTTADGEEHERFFLLDRTAEKPVLQPLTLSGGELDMIGFFEPSPDGRELLVGGNKSIVWRVALATGRVERLAGAADSDEHNYPLPAWRAGGGFSYLRRAKTGAPFELVLRDGETERVLSTNWPAAALEKLVD